MDLIVLAAGEGSRFSSNKAKQFLEIKNLQILFFNLYKWNNLKYLGINNIYLVLPEKEFDFYSNKYKLFFDLITIKGGKTRGESVFKALKEVKSSSVIIHDGARVFFSKELIINMFKKFNSSEKKALIPISKITDTIKIKKSNFLETLNREKYVLVQTPQFFDTSLIKKAYEKNKIVNFDDSQLIEKNIEIDTLEGEWSNIKITNKEQKKLIDFLMINDEYYLKALELYEKFLEKE